MTHSEIPLTGSTAEHSDHNDLEARLDALVLVLNEELSLLLHLHYRLTSLRLLLLDGNPRFIQLAASDVSDATVAVVDHEGRTIEAISAARVALGSDAPRIVDIAAIAPASHRKVLLRLTREIDVTSRALSVLREAVQRQSASGRQAVAEVLDLTDGDDAKGARNPGHLFRGAF
ncbi:MAG: hypothetical protein R8J94_18205 [Acidimicrobiia bacterium]|nr:hypothetical protein [Acidimicrobiia bacterium]